MTATVLLRAAPLALIYAVLTDPSTLSNWLVGAVVGTCLALPAGLSGGRPSPGGLLRVLLLPWFVIGVVVRIAGGSGQTLHMLLVRRHRSRPGFVTCRAGGRSEEDRAVLALVESASPGSAVAALGPEWITIGLVDASAPEEHCAGRERWHRRFQRPMLG